MGHRLKMMERCFFCFFRWRWMTSSKKQACGNIEICNTMVRWKMGVQLDKITVKLKGFNMRTLPKIVFSYDSFCISGCCGCLINGKLAVRISKFRAFLHLLSSIPPFISPSQPSNLFLFSLSSLCHLSATWESLWATPEKKASQSPPNICDILEKRVSNGWISKNEN